MIATRINDVVSYDNIYQSLKEAFKQKKKNKKTSLISPNAFFHLRGKWFFFFETEKRTCKITEIGAIIHKIIKTD